ncbi:DUF3987 domain-containing protein [Paraburkholderia lycopersici]|nr:DUF3987 domain-containing protein [Paraburkholderia lycopersici]
MTAQQWAEHREWIEENARASLRGTLRTRGPGAAMKTPPPDIKVDPVFPGDEAGVLVARSAFSRRGIEKAAQRRAEHGDVQAQREASFGRARDAANDAPPAWPAITPLPDGELAAVQSFDMMLLPGALRPWAEDIVSHMQCPPDFVGVTIMGALGMVIGRRVGIPPRRATTGPNTATCGSAWWAVPP